ncbi:NUDIX hydrolase [Nocardioides insulae]|uniref:NUDIX hydrolase n=1 Tax=Nocardioides insulae TaxID=394734 RepID=UPI000425D59E|nr:NUDIX hydrolase [Nocardioides insulae]
MRIPIPPVSMPAETVAKAAEYAEGRLTPAEPRNAATVILMRPGTTGPEVYLLRRQRTMAFAAGMCVFPGGGVDPRDSDHSVAWAGPSPEQWAAQLGCTTLEARALVCAAVRETFEESGVLLAGTSADTVVSDVSGEDWEADRQALESRELSLTDFLDRRGLVLRTDLLGAWEAWTTPVMEPKRYRTWFFVAELPEGQLTRDVSTESTEVLWLGAGEALDRVEAGELAMMPPTYLNCLEIAQFGSPAEALAAAGGRSIEMFTPEIEPVDDGHALTMLPVHRTLLEARGRV